MSTIQLVRDKHVRVPQYDLAALHDEAVQITERSQLVLPAEVGLHKWMTNRMTEIKSAVSETHVSQKNGGKPILDQSVLGWRHPISIRGVPVPKLAMINPFAGNRFLLNRRSSGVGIDALIWKNYKDVMIAMDERSTGRRRVRYLLFTWNGVIPNEVRELIREEKGNYDHIYMLVDAPKDQWVLEETKLPKPRNLDPLVLGEAQGHLVVLAQFDPTPLELYVSTEFATRQLTA